MDERRDPAPGTGSQSRLIASSAGRLSPLQQAWSDYVTHATGCAQCRSLDAGKCDDAERLYRNYRQISDAAFDRLAEEG